MPEVLGYLAAGMLLGPALHGGAAWVDAPTIRGIAQFAVVFRMFLLGLDLDPRRLRGRWRPALTAGGLEMAACTAAGIGLAHLLGWSLLEGAVLGAALGTTSTSILQKALADRDMTQREDARAAGAATLTEDLIAMGLLAVLTVFGGAGDMADVGRNAVALLVFASLAFTAGAIFVPAGLDRLGRAKSQELMVMAVVGILFGFAALSFGLGAGPAIGAFLAGLAVGAARHAPGLSDRIVPLRDMLVPVAYVAIGLVLDVRNIAAVAPLALAAAVVFVLIKVVAIAVGLRLGGVPSVTSARAGAILGQAGTMGLVLACAPFLAPTSLPTIMAFAFVAWAFTVGLTPLRLRYGPDVAERIARMLGADDRDAHRGHEPHAGDRETRAAVYSLFLALGCAGALAALAALFARVSAPLLPAPWSLAPPLLVSLATGLAAMPFVLAAGVDARRAFRRRARQAALGPRRLVTRADAGTRGWTLVGATSGLLVALLVPLAALLTLAPDAPLAWMLGAFATGAALAWVRPRVLAALVDDALRLTAPRAAPADARLHDFRGVSAHGFEVEAVLVRAGTRAAWARLDALPLTERTGARIVAVLRAGAREGAALTPDLVVHPGDEVVVGGTTANVIAARRYLLEVADAGAPPAPTPGRARA